MTGGPILALRGVGRTYRAHNETVDALVGVDLTLADGEFVAVVGASGCGKSTLLRMVAGLEQPTAGEITLDGHPLVGPGPDRGMVFQQYTLFSWLTALGNVEAALRHLPRRERAAVAREHLAVVGLGDRADAYPAQLSGGMQQRVAIARALAPRPRILLMDEPFGALDAQTREVMQELLLAVWERDRLSVLFVTHDVDEAIFLADRVCVLASRPGRVREEIPVTLGRPRRLEQHTEPAFLALRQRVRASISRPGGQQATDSDGAVLAR